MPSPEWLLSNFITTRGAGAVAARTVKTWLLGLELWHIINGAPWHAGSLVKCALQGSPSSAPHSYTRPKCPPVTLLHLTALRQHLNLNDTFDAAVRGALLLVLPTRHSGLHPQRLSLKERRSDGSTLVSHAVLNGHSTIT